MMKKIGIITIHESPNYGACLQSYALYEYIRQQGCDVELIDLHRPIEFADYIPSQKFHRLRKPQLTLKQKIKRWLHIAKENTDANSYSPSAKPKFKEFNSNVKLSKPYLSVDELYENPPCYDLYITGSDQVWNPTQNYSLEPYFLTFVKNKDSKKISYASSIGITDLYDIEKIKFKEWLASYDAISVREEQGKILLESIVERDIKQVPDPTFLLGKDYWKGLTIKPEVSSKYILMFTLRHSKIILEYCKRISRESGLQLIVLGQIQPDPIQGEYIAEKNAGPKEFIGYIENAELVITDSFHCSVFSILLGAKNFYTYISAYNKRGSRIIDLLETFHLREHLLPTTLDKNFSELMKNTVDEKLIETIIDKLQKKGQDFLNTYIRN